MRLRGRTRFENVARHLYHGQNLRAWRKFLTDRPQAHRPLDIRDHVLSLRHKPISLGYPASNITQGYAREMPRLFGRLLPYDGEWRQWAEADVFLSTGAIHDRASRSHPGLGHVLRTATGSEILLFEQGFLASAHSWIEAYRDHLPEAACLGYVYDDIAHYYMADHPNRLTERLNSDFELSPEEIRRAEAVMARILGQRISKYNSQPLLPPPGIGTKRRRVLVCDQAYADASTVYGRIDDAGFAEMLKAAIHENPDAEILVKTHPDTASRPGDRAGYYGHLKEHDNIRLLRDPVNPYVILDLADTVYVGTSQIGLEALMAGKRVVCFGAPFYAGWGLTDDRQPIPHRRRTRRLVDIFHIFYLWYTIYHVPHCPAPAAIESVLDFIERHRPVDLSSPPRRENPPPMGLPAAGPRR